MKQTDRKDAIVKAARLVVSRWAKGDLAEAVRKLDRALARYDRRPSVCAPRTKPRVKHADLVVEKLDTGFVRVAAIVGSRRVQRRYAGWPKRECARLFLAEVNSADFDPDR